MCDLSAPHFKDENKAREHLEAIRWPDGPFCPKCGSTKTPYKIKTRPGLYKCAEYKCRKQFTVTVGTVFERSKIPLTKWLMATYLMCASKKGMSSHQLHRMLGVEYKTAWFMTHRIREAMREGFAGKLGGGGKVVEVDETFGNERKPRAQGKKGRGYQHKSKVLSLVERGGKVRSFHVAEVNHKTLKPILEEQIAADSHIMTDEAGQYSYSNQFGRKSKLADSFQAHDVVNHGIGEYVRGDIHTNVVEGYFSIFKRGLMGSYHHVSKKHLKRYLCEFDYRYNYRSALGFEDAERAEIALRGIQGKRLMYQRPS
jgi:transposase-like protein